MPVRGVPGSLMGTEWLLRQTYSGQQWVPFPHAGRIAYCAAGAQGDLCTGFNLAVLVVLLSLTPVRRNVEQSLGRHSHCLQSLLAKSIPVPEEVSTQQYDYRQFLSCPPLQGRENKF